MTAKRKMSLSLDLDNKWSYLKTHGDDAWKEFPSYLDLVVPRILKFLKERNLRITFFIVGQDADLDKNKAAIRMIADAGHEIGNHSFNHEPWLHLYSDEQIKAEIERAEVVLESVTGAQIDGFRGPGYSLSTATLRALKSRGYRYDASAFPNILNPLARAYFFANSKLTKEEKQQRKALFGSFSDALRPVHPYTWQFEEDEILELPVSTMPLFKVPFHFSYVIYLAGFSKAIAYTYWRFALSICKLTSTEPSLLLHPLDFLGAEDDSDLEFFPGMKMDIGTKLAIMGKLFDILGKSFEPLTVKEHVEQILSRGQLKTFDAAAHLP